jgi:hypothetical protein
MLSKRGLLALALLVGGLHAIGCNTITGVDGLTVIGEGGGGAGSTSSSSSSSSGHPSSSSSSSSSSGASSTSSSSSSSTTTTSSSSSTSTTSSSSTSSSSSSGSTTDPFEQYRQECIDKINALRATKGLAPYQRWKSAESCVDQQAQHDATTGKAHDAWSTGNPSCGGNGQNECPGWGASAISGCLDSMWNEKNQAGCSGCDACATFDIFGGNCPNCTFNGSTVCGHYVNMSSKTFTMAACGFSTTGGWAAINFQ